MLHKRRVDGPSVIQVAQEDGDIDELSGLSVLQTASMQTVASHVNASLYHGYHALSVSQKQALGILSESTGRGAGKGSPLSEMSGLLTQG